MTSKAATVAEYLKSLPDDRRSAIEAVRKVILANLDSDYEEMMIYGMIGYCVPHRVYPAGYHCDPTKPVTFAAIASQKNYMAVYLMCLYGDADHAKWFTGEWQKTGKKLDMGKSCIRFKKLEDLALDVIGQAIKRVPAKKYIESYTSAVSGRTGKKVVKPAKKTVKKSIKKPAK